MTTTISRRASREAPADGPSDARDERGERWIAEAAAAAVESRRRRESGGDADKGGSGDGDSGADVGDGGNGGGSDTHTRNSTRRLNAKTRYLGAPTFTYFCCLTAAAVATRVADERAAT